jgi:imidazolonepropionase
MNILLTNIGLLTGLHASNYLLRGDQLAVLPSLNNAYLLIKGESIASFGSMQELSQLNVSAQKIIDVKGGLVLPAWCDSHTHLVFAASREAEFVDKIKGLSYAEIAANGGGILNSAAKVQAASEEELLQGALTRLQEISLLGTGAVEIKSGYGLTVAAELKMLRVIQQLKKLSPVTIKATFLGAHAYPVAFRNDHEGYISQIIHEMLPAIAHESLADYLDVFCEEGFFSLEETERIINAGLQYGLTPKIHANQLHLSGGVQVGVKMNALSVDHLETMDEESIQLLANSSTIGTLLPNAAYFLRMSDPPARALIEAGAAIALASDYNPGSAPSGNMNGVVSQACIRMRLLPEESINAATLNGAHAMGLGEVCGSIQMGKLANIIITKPIPSLAYLPYSFGTNLIEQVIVKGQLLDNN